MDVVSKQILPVWELINKMQTCEIAYQQSLFFLQKKHLLIWFNLDNKVHAWCAEILRNNTQYRTDAKELTLKNLSTLLDDHWQTETTASISSYKFLNW